MYSQRAQVAIMLGSGAPKVLPKDPTERLKLVAAVVAAMTEPPPKLTHTGTTKGGASTSGSARDQIPDPGVAPRFPAPRAAVPTMAPGVGGGSSAESTSGPGVGRADVASAAAAQLIDLTIPLQPAGLDVAVVDACPAPAAAAQPSDFALSMLPADLAEDGSGREVRGGTRTPAPRLARTAESHCPTPALPQDQAAQVAEADAALAEAAEAEAALMAETSADVLSGPDSVAALPDTPSGSGIEVQAELVLCPWAESLGPADCPVLDAAWKYLTPLDREQVAYALVRLLRDTEITEKPKFNRVRVGALAVFSATYRRLRANEALRAPLAEDDAADEEQELDAPNFLAPLVAQIALSIRAKAQGVVVEDTPPDEKTLKAILGSLKRKTAAQREQAARLFRAARRALPDGAGLSNCCLAACLAILALKTLAEIDRLKFPDPDDWLRRYISFLEEADVVFTGQIGPLVSQEREPAKATISTAVPSLKTDSSSNATLRSQNRCPGYSPDMQGWRHVAGDLQDGWSGVGLHAVPVHPDAISLPEPPRDEEGYKFACPATAGPKLAGNHCLNCSTKKLRGGCVNRLDKSKGGVAHHQGHLTMHETPVYAMLWNVDGLPRREEDIGPGGFPSYLGDDPPLGRPLPGNYTINRRPCELPSLSPPPAPPTGAAPAGGADQDALGARRMFQAMVAARPDYTARPVLGSKANATMLASTAREQALPVADRALYPTTVAGGFAAHPLDRPDLYCFYRFCVPLARVPVQFLPWVRPPGAKAGSRPHPSWSPSWAATADGQAFFRLTEEEQAQALADYDANPEHAPTPATGSPPLGVAAVPRSKRARAPDRAASRKRPKQVAEPLAETEDEAEDGSSLIADSAGLLQVIVLNDPSEAPTTRDSLSRTRRTPAWKAASRGSSPPSVERWSCRPR